MIPTTRYGSPRTFGLCDGQKVLCVKPVNPGLGCGRTNCGVSGYCINNIEPTDPEYAETCLTHAKQIFEFGDKYRGKNPLDVLYPSGGYLDDLAWGAVWLYIKTGDSTYLEKAKSFLPVTSLGGGHTHCWDDVSYGAALK